VKWNEAELLRVEDAIFRNELRNGAPQQAKAQIFAKGECAAGSVMGFLNVCSASVVFFMHPILLTFKYYFVRTSVS
jgi:hypothetical protein